jgi:hypothetical protein
VRSEIKFDLGEQAEQDNHNLGLQVLLSLEVDAPETRSSLTISLSSGAKRASMPSIPR